MKPILHLTLVSACVPTIVLAQTEPATVPSFPAADPGGAIRPLGDLAEIPAASSPWSMGAGVMWRRIGNTSVHPNLAASQPAGAFFSPPQAPVPQREMRTAIMMTAS